jgi:hypothetical protein
MKFCIEIVSVPGKAIGYFFISEIIPKGGEMGGKKSMGLRYKGVSRGLNKI